VVDYPPYRLWSDSDFDKVSSIDVEARRGGYVVALLLGLLFAIYLVLYSAVFVSLGSYRMANLILLGISVSFGILGRQAHSGGAWGALCRRT